MTLTSHDELGDTGNKTRLREVAAHRYVFQDADATIPLASLEGGNASNTTHGGGHVVQGGLLIPGQNPAPSGPAAAALLRATGA